MDQATLPAHPASAPTPTRRNYTILVIAKKGAGKTTMIRGLAEKQQNKIIVINTDKHPTYADYDHITVEQLKTWAGKKCVVLCRDEDQAVQAASILNRYQSNAFVIFEDAQKYIADNVQDTFKRLLINHRMRGFDVCFLYHTLKFVPNKIAMNYEILFLFKTNDGNVNLQTKYANWPYIKSRAEYINKHHSPYYYEAIKDNE